MQSPHSLGSKDGVHGCAAGFNWTGEPAMVAGRWPDKAHLSCWQTSDMQRVRSRLSAAVAWWVAHIHPLPLALRVVPGLGGLCGCLWELPHSRGQWHLGVHGGTGPLMDQHLHLGTYSALLHGGRRCVVQPLPRLPPERWLWFLSKNLLRSTVCSSSVMPHEADDALEMPRAVGKGSWGSRNAHLQSLLAERWAAAVWLLSVGGDLLLYPKALWVLP